MSQHSEGIYGRVGEAVLKHAAAPQSRAAPNPQSPAKEELILQHGEKVFIAEEERTKRLDEKAEKIIAAVSLVIGFHLVDLKKLILHGTLVLVLPTWIAVIGLGCLSAALVLAFLARRIRNYAGCSEGMALIEDLREDEIDVDLARLLIARMYLRARDRNWTLNNRKARQLSLSGWFLIIGFLLAAGSLAAFKLFNT